MMNSLRRILSPGRVLLSGFFILLFSVAVQATDENIPPSSWVYRALRRFELLGLVSVSPDMPLSRSSVRDYVRSMDLTIEREGLKLKPREAFLLKRLKEEFLCDEGDLSSREDRPIIVYSEGKNVIALDASIGASITKRVERVKGEVDGTFIPQVLAGLGKHVTFESNYDVEISPEVDDYRRNRKPSPRTRSFRGVTSEFERGYVAVHGDLWRFDVGRDYVNLGDDLREGLLVSRTAGSLDRMLFSFRVSRFDFKVIHAVLDPGLDRRLAVHRMTARLPGNIYLGIGEAVLYGGRGLDLVYLVPFSSYYANQFNERADDNILWSFDWKVPFRRFLFFGEVLIDDLQYEREEPAPDRIGLNVAFEALLPAGREDLTLRFSYTYIDIFTYAHKDSLLTSYVTGDGSYPENPLIGSSLGPDADRLYFGASYPVSAPLDVGFSYEVVRRGEGNDLREWDRVEDPGLPFPSGNVLTERFMQFTARYDLGRGSFINVNGGVRFQSGGLENRDGKDYFGSIELRLDL